MLAPGLYFDGAFWKSGGPDFSFEEDEVEVGVGVVPKAEVDDEPNGDGVEFDAPKADGAPNTDCPPPPPKGELDELLAPNGEPLLFAKAELAEAGARAPKADVGAGAVLFCAPNAEVVGC